MNSEEFIKAVKNIVKEKGISEDVVFEGMEQALTTAYKKNFDSKTNVRVDINRETGEIKVYSYLVVVDDVDYGSEEIDEEKRDRHHTNGCVCRCFDIRMQKGCRHAGGQCRCGRGGGRVGRPDKGLDVRV